MKKKISVVVPVTGKVVALEEVNDPMFANKVMGEGIAFDYEDNHIYSPADGTIVVVAATNHAIGIEAENGAELLLHIGTETVNLKGKGFDVHVQPGDKVHKGQLLMTIDRKVMADNNIDLITPMILTNGQEAEFEFAVPGSKVQARKTEVGSIAMEVLETAPAAAKESKYENLCKEIILNSRALLTSTE